MGESAAFVSFSSLPGKRLDGVNDVVVVTDDSSDAVGVTIVAHAEGMEGCLALATWHSCMVSLLLISGSALGAGGRNLLVGSFNDRAVSSVLVLVDCG